MVDTIKGIFDPEVAPKAVKVLLVVVGVLCLTLCYTYTTGGGNCLITKSARIQFLKKRAQLKQDIYAQIIDRAQRALAPLGIKPFLSSGTLLGYFREGKIIDHDYDVDLGILSQDYTPQVTTELEKYGFRHYRTLGDRESGMELSYYLPGTRLGRRAKLDIFLHYPEGDKVSWYTYAAPFYKKKIQYRVSKFGITEGQFLGLTVNVPDPTLKYIEEHYGEDWNIPKKPFTEYKYHSSPKSIVT